MSTPWSETLFPYGAPVGVAPASAISNDLQINKNNPGIQFLGTEANAVFSEEREIAGDLWFVTNATYASTGTPGQWTQVNAAAASYALVLRAAGPIQRLTAPSAAPNPVVWTTISSTDALGNQSLTAGTLTGPSSIPLAITATWNAPAQAMTAQRINVTDTASAANSLLLDLQVGGVSKFSVRKDGLVTFGVTPVGPGGATFIDTSSTGQTKTGQLGAQTFVATTATGSYQIPNAVGGSNVTYLDLNASTTVTGVSATVFKVSAVGVKDALAVDAAGQVGIASNLRVGGSLYGTSALTYPAASIATTALGAFPAASIPTTALGAFPPASIPTTALGTFPAGSIPTTALGSFASGAIPNAALVTTPLDVSSTAQTKTGALTVSNLTTSGTPPTPGAGSVGIGNDTSNTILRSGTGGFYFQNGSGGAQVGINALSATLGTPLAVTSGGTGLASLTASSIVSTTAGGAFSFLALPLAVANGGTGSAAQNFVDLTTAQTVAGTKTFSTIPAWTGGLPILQGGTGSTTQNFVDLTTPQSVAGAKTFTSTFTAPVHIAGTAGADAGNFRLPNAAGGTNQTFLQYNVATTIAGVAASTLKITASGVVDALAIDSAGRLGVAAQIAAQSDGSHPGWVPPVYTAAGAALASTTHIVQGYGTSSGGTLVVTLSGAAVFSSATSYTVTANSESIQFVEVTRTSGTSFTLTCYAAGGALGGAAVLDWIAVGS